MTWDLSMFKYNRATFFSSYKDLFLTKAASNIEYHLWNERRYVNGSDERHSNENEWKREFQDHLLKNLYPKIDGPATTFCNTWTILFMQTYM